MTADLAEARGPDVACSIEVPVAWFEAGATLQIQLPRLMTCARCEGGGCDACGRRGAFEQQAAGLASEVAVVLPKQPAEACAPVKLRLPALGARAPKPPAVEDTLPAAEAEPAAEAHAAPAAEGQEHAAHRQLLLAEGELPPVAEGEALPAAGAAGEPPRELPPGHLLLTVIPRAPDPTWVPPSNVQALVLAPAQRSLWAWLRPLELLLFPDRLLAALRGWWQTAVPVGVRSLPIWIWAALAVLLTVLGFWLLTRSGSRSQ